MSKIFDKKERTVYIGKTRLNMMLDFSVTIRWQVKTKQHPQHSEEKQSLSSASVLPHTISYKYRSS